MNKERLEKLCTFLDTLPDDKFRFSSFVAKKAGGCGTVCCAVGWCPLVFPEDWAWEPGLMGVRRSDKRMAEGYQDDAPLEVAAEFFGLSPRECAQAFLPWDQSEDCDEWSNSEEAHGLCDDDEAHYAAYEAAAASNGYCHASAGPREVAANIRRIMKELA